MFFVLIIISPPFFVFFFQEYNEPCTNIPHFKTNLINSCKWWNKSRNSNSPRSSEWFLCNLRNGKGSTGYCVRMEFIRHNTNYHRSKPSFKHSNNLYERVFDLCSNNLDKITLNHICETETTPSGCTPTGWSCIHMWSANINFSTTVYVSSEHNVVCNSTQFNLS